MATYIPTGVQSKFFGKIESAGFDTVSAFVSADALPLISLDITPTKEFINSRERTGTATLQRRITGSTGGTWSATFYMKPNGSSVTTQPDAGALLKAAMGAVDTTSTVKYEFKTSSGEVDTISTLQLARHIGKGQYEIINGAWVESLDCEFNTNAENTFTVSGGFASYGYCFGSRVSGAFSSSDTVITVEPINYTKLLPNAYVQFDDGGTVSDNSSAGYLITAVDSSAGTFTISPGLDTGIADDTEVQPFTPAQTMTTNDPIFGTSNGFHIAALSATLNMTAGKVSVSTGFHSLANEGQSGKPVRVVRGERAVTAEGTFYLVGSEDNTVDQAKLLGMGHHDFGFGCEFQAGSASKSAIKIGLQAKFNVSPVTVSETDESTFSMSIVAVQDSVAGDEMSIDFW